MKAAHRVLAAALLAAGMAGTLVACGGGEPEIPSSGNTADSLPTAEQLMAATPVDVAPSTVSETFALGSRSTDLQRELLEKQLVGQVVDWTLKLYEVQLENDVYTVSSDALQEEPAEGVPLIRVVASVRARIETEHAYLRTVKTGDSIRLRGRVTGIVLRTALLLDPAVVIVPAQAP
jgi:hypothetical protein